MTRNSPFRHDPDTDETLIGGWASVPAPATAELLATAGHDFVVVDVEHTPVSLETTANMLRAVDAAPGQAATVVRVADDDRTTLNRTLDLGPDAILVPRVDSADQAERIVADVRYPPGGTRGVGPGRASGYGQTLGEHVEAGDDAFALHVQLESEAAVRNAPAIAAVDGIDGVFLGPMDLSLSLGCFTEWSDERFRSAVEDVLSAAADAGVAVGTFATDADTRARRFDWGVEYLVGGVDLLHVGDGASEAVAHADRLRDGDDGS